MCPVDVCDVVGSAQCLGCIVHDPGVMAVIAHYLVNTH